MPGPLFYAGAYLCGYALDTETVTQQVSDLMSCIIRCHMVVVGSGAPQPTQHCDDSLFHGFTARCCFRKVLLINGTAKLTGKKFQGRERAVGDAE